MVRLRKGRRGRSTRRKERAERKRRRVVRNGKLHNPEENRDTQGMIIKI